MSEVFGPAYATVYDLIYADKDYEAECDALERAFREFCSPPVRRVVDLGSGTGGHALPLARRGYEVVGIDRSPGMRAEATAKAAAAGLTHQVTFLPGDLTVPLEIAPRDAALMMFNVLGYQTSTDEVRAAFASVRASLRPGGLFLFDVWSAAAVERDPPAVRQRIYEQGGRRLRRVASGVLDKEQEHCTITISVQALGNDRVSSETVEVHTVRYFRIEALAALLGDAGLDVLRIGSFPEYWREPRADDWNMMVVAISR